MGVEEPAPPAVAAEVHAQVARIRAAVVRQAGRSVQAELASLGVDYGVGSVLALLRYRPADAVLSRAELGAGLWRDESSALEEDLRECLSAGLLEQAAEGGLRRTARGLELTERIRLAMDTAATELWGEQREVLSVLVPLMERAARAAFAQPGDRLSVFGWPDQPYATPAEQVMAELAAVLWYHRTDVLRRVCEAEGLTSTQVEALEQGQVLARIQERTDRLAGRPYGELSGPERALLLRSLGGVPG
jgi:hypothetical protein